VTFTDSRIVACRDGALAIVEEGMQRLRARTPLPTAEEVEEFINDLKAAELSLSGVVGQLRLGARHSDAAQGSLKDINKM
jgi:hypothetical protein